MAHRLAVGLDAVPVAELEPLGRQLMAALDAPGPFGNRFCHLESDVTDLVFRRFRLVGWGRDGLMGRLRRCVCASQMAGVVEGDGGPLPAAVGAHTLQTARCCPTTFPSSPA